MDYHPIQKKACKSCQENKRCTQKYGYWPSKIMISLPEEALCVGLVGPYTLKGLNGSENNFMAELLLVSWLTTKLVNGREKVSEELTFDKSSYLMQVSSQKSGCVDTRDADIFIQHRVRVQMKFEHMQSNGIKRKPTTIKNPQSKCHLWAHPSVGRWVPVRQLAYH